MQKEHTPKWMRLLFCEAGKGDGECLSRLTATGRGGHYVHIATWLVILMIFRILAFRISVTDEPSPTICATVSRNALGRTCPGSGTERARQPKHE